MTKYLCTALLPLVLFVGCSKDKPKSPSPDENNLTLFQNKSQLTVTSSSGKALVGAQVLIGPAEGNPFSGNLLTTDKNGAVSLPKEWTSELPVTIEAPGHVRLTYLAQSPGGMAYTLRPTPQRVSHEVRGTALNLPIKNRDGWVDIAMVMPALSPKDIFNFNISKIISPNTDTISQLGQEMYIPSNVSIPNQEERYAFFTITLDKPAYRLYIDQPGMTRLFAARAKFQFKPVAEALQRGASFYSLINDMQITGGVIRDVDIKTLQTVLDLPTQELNFTTQQELQSPTFRTDESFVALSLANSFGQMVPTDIKRPENNRKFVLNGLPGSPQMFVGVLKKTADLDNDVDRMSVAYTPLTTGMTPKVLPLIADPILNPGELQLPHVTPVSGVADVGAFIGLSQVVDGVQGGAKVTYNVPLWDIYAPTWVPNVKLPTFPNDQPRSGKKRWEVNFVGSQKTSQPVLGPAMIENATHVTHSSIVF